MRSCVRCLERWHRQILPLTGRQQLQDPQGCAEAQPHLRVSSTTRMMNYGYDSSNFVAIETLLLLDEALWGCRADFLTSYGVTDVSKILCRRDANTHMQRYTHIYKNIHTFSEHHGRCAHKYILRTRIHVYT